MTENLLFISSTGAVIEKPERENVAPKKRKSISKNTMLKRHEFEFHLQNKLNSIIGTISKSINSLPETICYILENALININSTKADKSQITESKMQK